MSMCYWMNEGIGVDSDTIYPYLDMHKCYLRVKEQMPEEQIDEDDFCLEDYFEGDPFENIGDFLWHVGDNDRMTWGDNGDGVYYYLYSPSYPWERQPNEPDSIDEVHKIIVDAIQKVTNLSREEAEKLIRDDIYEYGCG